MNVKAGRCQARGDGSRAGYNRREKVELEGEQFKKECPGNETSEIERERKDGKERRIQEQLEEKDKRGGERVEEREVGWVKNGESLESLRVGQRRAKIGYAKGTG